MSANDVGVAEDVPLVLSDPALDEVPGFRPFQGTRSWWDASWCPSPLAAALWPPTRAGSDSR